MYAKTLKNRSVRKNVSRTIYNHPYIKKHTPTVWAHNIITGSGKYPKWKGMHKGGKRGSIEKAGYTFIYDDNGDSIICIAKRPYKGMCFKIIFDEETGTIGVDISYSAGCAYNKPLPKSSGTLIMLQAVMELILTNKNINNYKCIVVTDNSSIDCRSHYDGELHEVRLMDMYYVATGCTWYSSIAPMFLMKESDEKKYITHKSRILSDLSWTEFLNRMPQSVRDKINEDVQFENANTSYEPAHTILNKIRQGHYHCIFFKDYMHEFLHAFDVESMFGKEWCIPLRRGKIVSCEDDVITSVCKHPEKGWIIPHVLITNVSLEEFMHIKRSIQTSDVPKSYILEKNSNNTIKY